MHYALSVIGDGVIQVKKVRCNYRGRIGEVVVSGGEVPDWLQPRRVDDTCYVKPTNIRYPRYRKLLEPTLSVQETIDETALAIYEGLEQTLREQASLLREAGVEAHDIFKYLKRRVATLLEES